MTIVNVSVPSISGSLGVSTSEGTWAISSYMLAAAVMQPMTGWIGRRFGEVRTFVTSILLFMCFSALCGLATSLPMLVAARLIQGLVSGPMMSVAQSVLRIRLRHFLGRLPQRHRELWSICHAAFPARFGDRIFLPAAESNNAVRDSAERLGIRLGSE
jgi:MFS family permease